MRHWIRLWMATLAVQHSQANVDQGMQLSHEPALQNSVKQVALPVDEGEDEVSYCDEEDEVIVTIHQGESEGESEDGDENEDGYDNLI
ncbi:hypothetical protein DPX16_13505 [Anabarilius grahami]|uniref:Uncharacterized protein n=1 Tax=Anabarilius grahami TaxID=495550 RepID=A0A3N0YBW2_ANAGA|nr:hypothetical protein DPX16_13505 [Anabarilius grahami]